MKRRGLLVALLACLPLQALAAPSPSPAASPTINQDLHAIHYDAPFADADDACGTSDAGSVNLSGKDNIMKVMNFLVGKGLKPYVAAGIVGNLAQESRGVDPSAQQDGSNDKFPKNGVGFGIAQWTYSVRQDPLVALAKKLSPGKTDAQIKSDGTLIQLELQVTYLWEELSGDSTTKPPALDYSAALRATRDTTNITDATTTFELKYEGAGNPNMAARIGFANDALSEFQSSGGQTTGTTQSDANDICQSSDGAASAAACATATGNVKILNCALTYDPYLYDWGGGHGGAKAFYAYFQKGVADGSIKPGQTAVLDCSGLVGVAVYMAFGIDDVQTSGGYAGDSNWERIPISSAKPGDIVWFSRPDGHVAIVASNGGDGDLTVFAARSASLPSSQQISYTKHTSYSTWNGGALHYIGKGATP